MNKLNVSTVPLLRTGMIDKSLIAGTVTSYSLTDSPRKDLINTYSFNDNTTVNIKLFDSGDRFVTYKKNGLLFQSYITKDRKMLAYKEKDAFGAITKNPQNMMARFLSNIADKNRFLKLVDFPIEKITDIVNKILYLLRKR